MDKPICLSTLAVSDLWVVLGIGDEDPEEFGLTLDGLRTVPHQGAVGREGTLWGIITISDT